MRASVIFAPHFVHGASIRRSRNKVGAWGETGMNAHHTRREHNTLSHRWKPMIDGDGGTMELAGTNCELNRVRSRTYQPCLLDRVAPTSMGVPRGEHLRGHRACSDQAGLPTTLDARSPASICGRPPKD